MVKVCVCARGCVYRDYNCLSQEFVNPDIGMDCFGKPREGVEIAILGEMFCGLNLRARGIMKKSKFTSEDLQL